MFEAHVCSVSGGLGCLMRPVSPGLKRGLYGPVGALALRREHAPTDIHIVSGCEAEKLLDSRSPAARETGTRDSQLQARVPQVAIRDIRGRPLAEEEGGDDDDVDHDDEDFERF